MNETGEERETGEAVVQGEAIVQGEDRRKSRRQRVLKSGLASFNDDYNTMPCVMRNFNENGARLEFEALTPLPASFMLHVGLDGYQVECRRIWREGTACGVEFVGEQLPTRLFHVQKLGTSETALSEHALRAIELNGRAEGESDTRPAVVEISPRRPATDKPSFGRRA